MTVNGTHPLAEIILRKTFGIESCPPKEQKRMIERACKAAVKYHDSVMKNKYIYSPPAWIVCEKCGGTGKQRNPIIGTCSRCHGTGRIPIYYTPEQWQEAGGVLSDDTPVWIYIVDDVDIPSWEIEIYRYIRPIDTAEKRVIIATEAGKPPEDYHGT
jgi:hypothetical protein